MSVAVCTVTEHKLHTSGILYPWYKVVQDGMYWYEPVRTLVDTRPYKKPQIGTRQYVLTSVIPRSVRTGMYWHHHHHASLLKSSTKQVVCCGAWAPCASFSLSLSLGVWALSASHSLSITTLCRVFDRPAGLSLSNTIRASSADQLSSP